MKYTEERKTSVNILFFIISILGLFILPSVFYTFMRTYFDDSLTLQFLSERFVVSQVFRIAARTNFRGSSFRFLCCNISLKFPKIQALIHFYKILTYAPSYFKRKIKFMLKT